MADSAWTVIGLVITQIGAAAMLWWTQRLATDKARHDAAIASAALAATVEERTGIIAATVANNSMVLDLQTKHADAAALQAQSDAASKASQLGTIHTLVNSRLTETNAKLEAALDHIARLEAVLVDIRETRGITVGQAAVLKAPLKM